METTANSKEQGAIGVFDSGYGGLTILSEIRRKLPGYDYIYLGDNARAPYGSRSFDIVYSFTLQAVEHLFSRGCRLVILACNTASAKALRTIQQHDLPRIAPERRVLGVIRPTIEAVGALTKTGRIGVLGTTGTIQSESYQMEIKKMYPSFVTYGQACPMWVPLVECQEADGAGADYFVGKYVDELFARDAGIDTVVLGCTHYPLLYPKIRRRVPAGVSIVTQGAIVADSLADYLRRHPEIDARCSKGGACEYLTTESSDKFSAMASAFLADTVEAKHVNIQQ